MKVAVVSHSLPSPSSNGGPIACWAVMQAARAAGHQVAVIALRYPADPFAGGDRQELILSTGAELHSVAVPPDVLHPAAMRPAPARVLGTTQSILRPRRETLFPTARIAPAMRAVLREVRPDAVFAYHWDTLAALAGAAHPPVLGIVDDPWHLPNLRRWQAARPRPALDYARWTLHTLRDALHSPGFMVRLLNGCAASGCFQPDAARWLRLRGARGCRYFTSPVPDACGRERALSRVFTDTSRPRILLGPSNVQSTSTAAGIRFFATEILPELETRLGADGFEVRVVGEGQVPEELARRLPHPSVKVLGRIEPADDEFLLSDVQLVPTPFVLGMRKRIAVGFSFGACVVAHACEAVNIPEMIDGRNALLGENGKEVAAQVVRAVRDPALRKRLSVQARETYERHFSLDGAARPIVRVLEDLAAGRSAA